MKETVFGFPLKATDSALNKVTVFEIRHMAYFAVCMPDLSYFN